MDPSVLRLLVALPLAWLMACTMPPPEGHNPFDDVPTPAADDDASADTDGTADGSTDESTGDAPTDPPPAGLAAGITVTRVTANQGVQVDIGRDGFGVGPAERQAPLVAGRRTLVRAFWTLDDDFEAREIRARLTLRSPAEEHSLTYTQTIDRDAEDHPEGPYFWWILEPDDVVPGLEYSVELSDAEPSEAPVDTDTSAARLPVSGVTAFGVEASPTQLRVVVVPIVHQLGGCAQVPPIGPSEAEIFSRTLDQLNPVAQLDLQVRDAVLYEASLGGASDFSDLLTGLSQLRSQDGAAPNVYYYGIVASCDGLPGGGIVGQAFNTIPSPLPELGYQRVAVGWWGGNAATTVITMIHELGHTQGLRHVACAGTEGAPDPSYPWPGGITNTWGFGIHDESLHAPGTSRDYMTYCAGYWVSGFTWRKTFDVIRTLSGWDGQAPDPGSSPGMVVHAAIYGDGRSDWWTTSGDLGAAVVDPSLRLRARVDGRDHDVPVLISQRPHGHTIDIAAALPRGTTLDALALHGLDEVIRPVDSAAVRRLDGAADELSP
ncbi:MAG: hypothetical protein AAF799_11330 [Myxococcota bacterium]